MSMVNMHEAKSNLSRLVEAVETGAESEVIIARNGKPVARLTAIESRPRKPLRFGVAKGRFTLPDDFDTDNDYIAALFNGDVDG